MPLSRAIEIKGPPTLRNLRGAAAYALSQPCDEQWSRIAELLMEAEESGDATEATRQFENLCGIKTCGCYRADKRVAYPPRLVPLPWLGTENQKECCLDDQIVDLG